MYASLSPSSMGFLLALTTALMWGLLPVVLKLLLLTMDAYTITSVRFLFAGLFVLSIVYFHRSFPRMQGHGSKIWLLLVASIMFLVVNYVTNVLALEFISPDTVALIMQLAPFILLLGGVLIYGESFSALQVAGAVVLFVGMLMFFNQRIPIIMSSEQESIEGVIIVIFSAIAWALYALLQKKLLGSFTSQQLTLMIYLLGGIILVPLSQFIVLLKLTPIQWLALLFCCVNTIIAYGAFTHAMQIWEASKVSAVIAITPVFTYFGNEIAIVLAPDIYFDSQMDWVAYFGACLIILGAMLASIGKSGQRFSGSVKKVR